MLGSSSGGFGTGLSAFAKRTASLFNPKSHNPESRPESAPNAASPRFSVSELGLKAMWSTLTLMGTRHIPALLPLAYRDTTFFFEGPAVHGHVALTIDDGLSRNGEETSLVRSCHCSHSSSLACQQIPAARSHASAAARCR